MFHHADYTVEARFAPRRLEDLLQASIAADTAALAEVLRDPAVEQIFVSPNPGYRGRGE